jgi:glycosyltransferase involved in cell wall biosynthesis
MTGPLNLVIDGTPLLFRRSGIGRYTYELLLEFARADPPVAESVANLGFRLKRLPRPLAAADLDRLIRRQRYWGVAFHLGLLRLRPPVVAAQARRAGAHVYFAPNFLGVYGRGFRTVATIHDLVYHLYPEYTQPAMLRALRRRMPAHAARADGIVTDSHATKKDIVSTLGVPAEKVTVIPLAAGSEFRPVADPAHLAAVRAKYDLPERFVLFVGNVEPRKNLLRLLAAVERLAADPAFRHRLVIVGARGWKSDEIMARLDALAARKLAVHLGYVPDVDLPAIYTLADLFAFPSLYEGFGIPPLEAMACGVPVICSNASSLPEVCGDAAVYFDPRSEEELVEAIRSVLRDDGLTSDLRERGLRQAAKFSWRETARRLLTYFASLRQAPCTPPASAPRSGPR